MAYRPPNPPTRRYPLINYLRVENAYTSQVREILEDASAATEAAILKALGRGATPLTRAQLQAQRAAIKGYLKQPWLDIRAEIDAGQRVAASEAVKVMGRYEAELLSSVLTKDQVEAYIAGEAQRAASGVRTLMDRIESSYKPLSQTVYRAQVIGNGYIDHEINVAIVRGLSARDFAKSISGLINPLTPGGVSYAAMRTARTELNNAFHASSIDRMNASGVVEGVNWNLSSSHPEGDVCDSLASESPYDPKNVPEKPHPQCLCFLTPKLPDRETFLANLLGGKYGEEPWYGDAEF